MLDERYQRNIFTAPDQEKINNTKVLLAGTGGLGSSLAYNLAGLGIHTIGLVDFDTVELSNLNRQYLHTHTRLGLPKVESAKFAIEQFNTNIQVITHNCRLTETCSLIEDYDIVIDCFDNFESKLALNKACIKHLKPLIHAGVERISGQVMTIIPNETACLSCLLGPSPAPHQGKAIIAPIINIIGSIAAYEAINLILNNETLSNKVLFYELNRHAQRISEVRPNPNCKVCR